MTPPPTGPVRTKATPIVAAGLAVQHLQRCAEHGGHAHVMDMRELHDRMPVILEPADSPFWLGEIEDVDPPRCSSGGREGVLRLWPASKAVYGPELLVLTFRRSRRMQRGRLDATRLSGPDRWLTGAATLNGSAPGDACHRMFARAAIRAMVVA